MSDDVEGKSNEDWDPGEVLEEKPKDLVVLTWYVKSRFIFFRYII